MAKAVEITPIDPVTNLLPLPVLARSADFFKNKVNSHHPFHPRRSWQLSGDVSPSAPFEQLGIKEAAGLAVRYSRTQSLPIFLHDRYHKIFYGPPLPEDIKSQFTTVVLACAGVVPRQAIDLSSSGEVKIVSFSKNDYEKTRHKINFEAASKKQYSKRPQISNFLVNYMLEIQREDMLSQTRVESLVASVMRPRNDEERRRAAREILAIAIEPSIEELIPAHEDAKQERMVNHPRKNLGEIVLRFISPGETYDYSNNIKQYLGDMAA